MFGIRSYSEIFSSSIYVTSIIYDLNTNKKTCYIIIKELFYTSFRNIFDCATQHKRHSEFHFFECITL